MADLQCRDGPDGLGLLMNGFRVALSTYSLGRCSVYGKQSSPVFVDGAKNSFPPPFGGNKGGKKRERKMGHPREEEEERGRKAEEISVNSRICVLGNWLFLYEAALRLSFLLCTEK